MPLISPSVGAGLTVATGIPTETDPRSPTPVLFPGGSFGVATGTPSIITDGATAVAPTAPPTTTPTTPGVITDGSTTATTTTTTTTTAPPRAGFRDRDIRRAIRDALMASGAFDEVVMARQEDDYTTSGAESRKLIMEPLDQGMAFHHDYAAIENLMVDSRLKLSFLSRCDEPELRDERLEAMINAAYNAMIGVSWLGETFPHWCLFVQHAKWMAPKHPVRRADAIYSYRYEPGASFDTTE